MNSKYSNSSSANNELNYTELAVWMRPLTFKMVSGVVTIITYVMIWVAHPSSLIGELD